MSQDHILAALLRRAAPSLLVVAAVAAGEIDFLFYEPPFRELVMDGGS